jgi:hypothetical protein
MVRAATASRRWHGRINAELERRWRLRVVRVPPVLRIPVRGPADPKIDRLVPEPVFLCSSVRSGSTLLRAVLDSHSQIHAPHETHFRRLYVTIGTEPARQATQAMDLNVRDLEHLLWDRLLHRELALSGKQLLVEKTPSNVFAVDRLKKAWPGARFVFLIRHPFSIARSWHEGKPETRPMAKAITHTLKYMEHLEKARSKYDGTTVRYEDLTADPARETRRVCEFLGVPWEPEMLEYGRHDHGQFVAGIGDWREKIHTGSIQPGRPLPEPGEVPEELLEMCRVWGYL